MSVEPLPPQVPMRITPKQQIDLSKYTKVVKKRPFEQHINNRAKVIVSNQNCLKFKKPVEKPEVNLDELNGVSRNL